MENKDKLAIRVWQSNVTIKELLNKEETKIFKKLTFLKSGLKMSNIIICPQVNISSFADFPKEDKALWDFSNLSVDFLIIDNENYKPLMAIEYYGGGHYQGDEEKRAKIKIRDLCKQILCYKTGIELQIICFEDIFWRDDKGEAQFKKDADLFFEKNIFKKLESVIIGEKQFLENELKEAQNYIDYLEAELTKLANH